MLAHADEISLPLSSLKSPLRYPGGKSRAVNVILSCIPVDIKRLCSPFLGGGSIELACVARGIEVYAYDIFSPLIDFWKKILENPVALAKKIEAYYPLSKVRFYHLQKTYQQLNDVLERAAAFFVLNRCSFSGTTLSGGMSPDHPRFTLSSIERIRNFYVHSPIGLYINQKDFKETLKIHANDFLYLDPPYANGQALYGNKGDNHKDFDHVTLASMLSKRKKWLLSYNDCDMVRELYKNFRFINLKWTYGMNNSKKSNEVLIASHDLSL